MYVWWLYQSGRENLGRRSQHGEAKHTQKQHHIHATVPPQFFSLMHPLIPKQNKKSKIKVKSYTRDNHIPPLLPILSLFLSLPELLIHILTTYIYIASEHIDSVQKLILNPDMEFVDTRKLQLQQQQHLQQQPQPQEQHFHVLAVDDSVIDRKLLERLLRGSSCKGSYNIPFSFFPFNSSLPS